MNNPRQALCCRWCCSAPRLPARGRGCPSVGWRRLPVPTLAAGLASAHESLVSLCGEQACVVFPLSHILAHGGLLCALNAQGGGCAWGPRRDGPHLPACPPARRGFRPSSACAGDGLGVLPSRGRGPRLLSTRQCERPCLAATGTQSGQERGSGGARRRGRAGHRAHRRPARGSLHCKQSPLGSRRRPGANLETI